jgi:hypothetical protein
MSNKRQTAVEWHHEKVSNLIEMLKRKYVNQEEFLGGLINLRGQAKEMEKEQIVDAMVQHQIKHHNLWGEKGIIQAVKQAEQYYNETYNTNEP